MAQLLQFEDIFNTKGNPDDDTMIVRAMPHRAPAETAEKKPRQSPKSLPALGTPQAAAWGTSWLCVSTHAWPAAFSAHRDANPYFLASVFIFFPFVWTFPRGLLQPQHTGSPKPVPPKAMGGAPLVLMGWEQLSHCHTHSQVTSKARLQGRGDISLQCWALEMQVPPCYITL